MRKQLHRLLLVILLPMMALAPLQGVSASMDMISSQHIEIVPLNSIQKNLLSSDAQPCEQHSDHEGHSCHNGHCFSCSALIFSSYLPQVNLSLQTEATAYQSSVAVFKYASLLRPPKI